MESTKDYKNILRNSQNLVLETKIPCVSIIVPAYNVEKFIPRCIISLINQSLANIEIIIINDGSTDNTETICRQFANCDSRIKVVSQSNQKQGAARNKGIAIARGEYLSFVDADDWISIDFCEKMYNAAKSTNAQIACASIVRGNENHQKMLIEYFEQKTFTNIKEKFIQAKMPEFCFPCNKIFSRKALLEKKLRFREGVFYEDMIFVPDAISELEKMTTVADATYFYWKNPNSTIYKKNDSSRADKINAVEYLKNICNKLGLSYEKPLKSEYYFLGIKLLKIYRYRATTYYYLFGVLPIIIKKNFI